ncbi:MAG: hypothetical protein AAGA03_18285 [Planctomycetota bacterium]
MTDSPQEGYGNETEIVDQEIVEGGAGGADSETTDVVLQEQIGATAEADAGQIG